MKEKFKPSKTYKSKYKCKKHNLRILELGEKEVYCKECKDFIPLEDIERI